MAAVRLLVKEAKAKSKKTWSVANRAVLNAAWTGDARIGYVIVTPTAGLAKGNKSPKEWASEKMARAIFGGRDPGESKTAEGVWSRLDKLLEDVAPGYTSLFRACHLSRNLLKNHGRSVDLSLITALRRYCLVLPEDVFPSQVRTWPWSDDQVAQWVEDHKMAAGKKPEVVHRRVRRPVEPSFVIPSLLGSTDLDPSRDGSENPSRDEPVRKLKRLRPLAEACASDRKSPASSSTDGAPASSSTDGAPGSLASKWLEPP